jgi:hypothetical protein
MRWIRADWMRYNSAKPETARATKRIRRKYTGRLQSVFNPSGLYDFSRRSVLEIRDTGYDERIIDRSQRPDGSLFSILKTTAFRSWFSVAAIEFLSSRNVIDLLIDGLPII